jgi:hypothetical protein
MGHVKRTTKTAATSPKRVALAERRAFVLDLRKRGYTFHAIARHIGGVSVATCYRDIVESIAAITREPAMELIGLELLRLDEMQRAIYGDAIAGKPAAINACLAIMDRRAKLLGLYNIVRPGSTSTGKSSLRVLLPDGDFHAGMGGVFPIVKETS